MRSILASVVLGEGALQIHHRVRSGHWLWEQAGGFQVNYAARVPDRREYALRPGYHDARTSIDELGFRASPPRPDLSAGGPVIAVMGDSVPFGYGVGDDETYPHFLGRLLETHHQPARVLNAGVPSSTSGRASTAMRSTSGRG